MALQRSSIVMLAEFMEDGRGGMTLPLRPRGLSCRTRTPFLRVVLGELLSLLKHTSQKAGIMARRGCPWRPRYSCS